MKKLDKKTRKLVEAVRNGLEAETDFTLKDQQEDYPEKWLHIYKLREKEPSSLYVPIEVCFNPTKKTISLRFEEFYGLMETGGDDTIKGIANWFRQYAGFIEARHKQILELGYRLDEKHIDCIHHINFFYREDFTYDQVDDVIREAKKLIEEVGIIAIIW